jgi:hypothetical protein
MYKIRPIKIYDVFPPKTNNLLDTILMMVKVICEIDVIIYTIL